MRLPFSGTEFDVTSRDFEIRGSQDSSGFHDLFSGGVFVESVEVTDTSANAPHAEQTDHAIRWFSAGKDAYCDSLLFPGGEAWRWSQRGAGTATFCCSVSAVLALGEHRPVSGAHNATFWD
ncbi:hypothetical protein OG895_43910 [Streptomyces sp. NBC_00201]|uniref:hypothetical protein n=1 Tax=unclassified Streptomyces TaxID=2593676 RepID=UPI0022562939|nr:MULTISPECIES: hypothetical protein [unclassified Streptomyces]MCX5064213.1 hypothetical protein [Streptomyces sp. NBC_00452]MCX5251995.1 hypothetical protein [Streptomyces sp. NBC_00201]